MNLNTVSKETYLTHTKKGRKTGPQIFSVLHREEFKEIHTDQGKGIQRIQISGASVLNRLSTTIQGKGNWCHTLLNSSYNTKFMLPGRG